MRPLRMIVVWAAAGCLSTGCATTRAPAQCTSVVPLSGTAPANPQDITVTATTPAPVTAPGAVATQQVPTVPAAPAATPSPTSSPAPAPARRSLIQPDPDAFDIVAAGSGLSLHKPMFLLPYTYSPAYDGRYTEALFQISFKQRLFGLPLYAAYSQKSFWEAYDSHDSAPFRETDYNPELFYRYIPADRERWYHLGADVGFEHESNGKGLPDSRSWNRFYATIFQAERDHLVYWKWWYRVPENDQLPPTDPQRDDNPHIGYYYGYSELTYEQQLFGKQLARAMFRYNPMTGKGAINLQYTVPNSSTQPDFFWMFYVWQGYGEDLLNYNRSIFRVGVGLAFAR